LNIRKDSGYVNVSKRDNILVIAPRFPAINQPWMDTYFEQLEKHEINFDIYTANQNPDHYQEKVDRLNLRDHVLDFVLFSKSYFLCRALKKPTDFVASLFKCLKLSREISQGTITLFSSYLKLMYFYLSKDNFNNIGLIHTHEEIAGYEFLHLALVKNIPVIVTFHGLPPAGVGQLSSEKRRKLYRYSSCIIVNTKFAKKQVVSLGCDSSKVIVLPQGLPISDFEFFEKPCPNPGNYLQLLTVGRYQRDKGQGYVLAALRRLQNSGINAHYHLVGVGAEGRKYLTLMAVKLGVSKNVFFHQDVSSAELLRLYHHSHLFILSSVSSKNNHHEETQGVVLQEAQASGCIPIATKVGGIPECVNHKRDSLLVRDRSSKNIVAAINYLLDQPNEWKSYQQHGRINVELNFSADVIGSKMKDILVSNLSNM
jgi:glycosyltransferase involved in cell wall biosynthesis